MSFDLCNEITRKSASNLWFVSRSLSIEKHRLFTASYASMRVIDDFVDIDFLTMDEAGRNKHREDAINKIQKWRQNSSSASKEKFSGESDYPEIFLSLNETLGKTTLGEGPWQRMADAMIFDVNETPLKCWADFLTYCIGATAAPAEVFLYVLACHQDNYGRHKVDESLDFQFLAREMAVFCYLVHIMRDLIKDGQQGGQLITIPEDLLSRCQLSRDNIGIDVNKLEKLLQLLIEKAEILLPTVNDKEIFIKTKLQRREKLVLSTLLSIYRRLFEKIKARPRDFLTDKNLGLDEDRKMIAAKLGLLDEGV